MVLTGSRAGAQFTSLDAVGCYGRRVTEQPKIAGEALEDIIAVMRNVELGDQQEGLTEVALHLNDAEHVILRRALMRVEAELLVGDAETLDGASLPSLRTPTQRRHDAFMLIVQRVIEATGQDN